MSLRHDISAVLLVCTVLCCWVGALGMWRMRTPMDALHYVAVPSSLGAVLLATSVLVYEGFNQIGIKTALIAVILLGFNAAVSHATARAFRVRELRLAGDREQDQIARDPLGYQSLLPGKPS